MKGGYTMNKVKRFVIKHHEIIGSVALAIGIAAISAESSWLAVRMALKDYHIDVQLPENFHMAKFID